MPGSSKTNEVGVFGNRTRSSRSFLRMEGKQLACTSPASKVVPVCELEASGTLGAWRSANVLTDHIALEAGFSKQPYQAQCVTLDRAGGQERFVHLNKNATWFLAAVGGPKTLRCGLPAVTVIETLCDKVFGRSDKQVVEDEEENEEAVTESLTVEDDPMQMLG